MKITRCNNCNNTLDENAKYCSVCGTKVGEGSYSPRRDIMDCVYGPPPVVRNHKCKKCGYSWKNCVMIDRDKYCPRCRYDDIEVIEEDD